MEEINKRWESGLSNERSFWKKWLVKNVERYSKPKKLRKYFKELIGDKKKVSILDLGAGAISTIGYTWNDVEVNITLTDYLAKDYMELYKELGIKPVLDIEFQDMLDIKYPNNTFDIVNCRNAIDHCIDPAKAIKEMYRVCKPGGWVYLAHFSHEGKRQGYNGLHQWNLDGTEDGDCKIWNKETTMLLSDIIKGFITEYAVNDRGIQIGVSNKIHKPIIKKTTLWAGSHIPMLVKAIEMTNKPVLELGIGYNSTPLLHWLCADKGIGLLSLESDPEWLKKFLEFRTDNHILAEFNFDNSLDVLGVDDFGVVFVDHRPARKRRSSALFFKDKADIIILHDSELADNPAYKYTGIYKEFKYKYEYKRVGTPYTMVLSNRLNVERIFS
jgi:ubiquinone/menaquinone biosynthesis C-methylase UbiE